MVVGILCGRPGSVVALIRVPCVESMTVKLTKYCSRCDSKRSVASDEATLDALGEQQNADLSLSRMQLVWGLEQEQLSRFDSLGTNR
jgi:hypothetical protein